MKKFLILFLFIFLVGCDITEIDENLFVISMGLDYKTESKEIEVTLYFIPSASISKKELVAAGNNKIATATFSGTNETEIIRRIETTHNQAFQFTHISSYIMTTNYLENIGLQTMIDDIIHNPRRYPNFYLFVTENEIKDVYEHKNIDNISTYYSIIFNPVQVYKQHTEIGVKRVSDVISEYYEDSLTPTIPLIRINDNIWNEEKEPLKTIELYGYCYKKEKVDCLNIYDDPGIKFTRKSIVFIQTFETFNIKLKTLRNTFNFNRKNNTLTITYYVDINPISNPNFISRDEMTNHLTQFMIRSITELMDEGNDILKIEDYKYRNSISQIDEIRFQVKTRYI